jgi:hypothetical protein
VRFARADLISRHVLGPIGVSVSVGGMPFAVVQNQPLLKTL